MARKNAAKHSMMAVLQSKYHQGHGNSKREAKAAHNGVSPYIHGDGTYQSYRQQVARYGDWLTANHPETNYNTAGQYVQEYIDTMKAQKMSAWTQQLARAAIGKALGVAPTSLAQTEKRHADKIMRGRVETEHAAASAKYADDMSICECVGIRHNKEGKQVTPDNCHWSNGHISSVSIVGKGGRPRTAVVLPGKGRDLLEARCQTAKTGSTPLLGSMTGCNVHGARAKYAAGCYAKALSEGRGNGQMYSPKGKGLQKSYDKGALDYVNAQLGHGAGRYDVAVYNYLSYGGV